MTPRRHSAGSAAIALAAALVVGDAALAAARAQSPRSAVRFGSGAAPYYGGEESQNALAAGLVRERQSGWDRDALLPLAREMRDGQVVRGNGLFGSDWHLAVPKFAEDIGKAAYGVAQSPVLAPIPVDDQYRTQQIEGAEAVVGPQVAAGFVRNALAPRGGAEVGAFGGRLPPGYRAVGERDPNGPMNYAIEHATRTGYEQVGRAYVRDLGESAQVGRIAIDQEHARKGIGTALYGQIENDLGKPLVPDSVLTDAAHAFWAKHRPEAVAGYEKNGSFWQPGTAKPAPVPAASIDDLIRQAREVNQGGAGKVEQPGIRAYHGSPNEIGQFATPAFFSRNRDVADIYRTSHGSGDNINGIGGSQPPRGYGVAARALSDTKDRTVAASNLRERLAEAETPRERRELMDGIAYLESGKPAGYIYDVTLPEPAKDYAGRTYNDVLAKAAADGNKVFTMFNGQEIVVTDPSLIKTNAKEVFSDSIGPQPINALMKEARSQQPGIRAFHGSPHDFDKFSLDKIGTGEGAQSYGHGLYFAENEGVAQNYRDALANIKVGGKEPDLKRPDHWIAMALDAANGNKAKAVVDLRRDLENQFPDNWPAIEEAIRQIESGSIPNQLPPVSDRGRMYEVNIKADPESFLDWDKPLSQQSEKVRQALAQYGIDRPDWTGGQIHESSKLVPGERMDKGVAAQRLREAGIPGIRYLDQGSRGKGDGSRNLVVFDDSLIEILRKYGLAGMMAGGASLASQGDQQQ